MKYFFALLLVVACALQAGQAGPVVHDDSDDWESLELINFDVPSHEGVIQDIGGKAKVLITRLKNYISKKVHSALDLFKKVEEKLKTKVNGAIDIFKPKLQRVVDDAKMKLKKKALELKKDAKECLAHSEVSFKEMLKTFLIGEEHCVTDELHKAISIVHDTISNVLGAVKKIENLPNELIKCLDGKDKFTCVKHNIWDTGKAQGKAMKNFVKEVADGTTFVVGLETRLASCALTQLTKAADSCVTLIEKFPECLLKKILH